MSNQYERLGTTNEPTKEELDWVNGLLVNKTGRARTMLLATYGPDERGDVAPRMTRLFSAFHHVRGGPLRAVWASERSSIHSLHISEQQKLSQSIGGPALTNTIDLGDSSSKNVALQMRVITRELPPEERQEALGILIAIRQAVGEDPAEINIGPRNQYDAGREMYEAVVVGATIQGPRYNEFGFQIQEGHPQVDISQLRGHDWPAIKV